MRRLSTLFPLACCLLIAGCGQEPASVPPVIEQDAHAKKLSDGTYEVQLRYSVTTSGGPCLNIHSFSSTTDYETNWIYLKSLKGAQDAAQIIVSDTAGKREWPYVHTNLQGTVSFTDATMVVQLQGHGYDYKRNVETAYVPYFLNGTYQVVTDSSPNTALEPTPTAP